MLNIIGFYYFIAANEEQNRHRRACCSYSHDKSDAAELLTRAINSHLHSSLLIVWQSRALRRARLYIFHYAHHYYCYYCDLISIAVKIHHH